MKNFGRTGMLFLLYAIAVYLILLMVFGSLPLYLRQNLHFRIGDYGHMHSRMKDVKKINNTDILFLGSSHAYRGFDTRIFQKQGYNSFNLGSSGQTPLQTLMLLEKYLDQLNPRLVVFEVYPELFSLDGVESSIDILSNEKIDFHSIKMVFQIHHIKTYNTFLYSSIRQLAGLDKNFSQPQQDGKDYYVDGGGFVAREKSFFGHVKHEPASWTFNPEQMESFDQIIALLRKRKVNYVLVQAPFTSSLYHSITNNHVADSIYHTKGKYINFNTMIQLDDSLHFYDADHLNQDGVELFNEAFIQWMKKEKLLE